MSIIPPPEVTQDADDLPEFTAKTRDDLVHDDLVISGMYNKLKIQNDAKAKWIRDTHGIADK